MSMDIMAHNVGICPTIYSKGIGVLQQVTLLLWHGIAILEGLNFTEIQRRLFLSLVILLFGDRFI